ncbi:MAG: A/G-specific adenine glycosylase [Flavobacterium sp.]|jgi:A/G-specific adenine glycosylase|uniref:A/G-specific adenine glycosylase n=1 Tax=Flavobacterium sp. TaxID=239 RepID=UPI0022C696A1|nr:A/G-specific adenine glycosylase [Flavobacterium sp.]MCZ8169115.1 A/G-specific adenine glycosylase [Flavobacterium sp.]MCZ8297824.1 A/G-specific adenine glycosylase [Flavobacterium sp.]
MEFTNSLLLWYLENQRELPWRQTRDPYCIWLSEIMLQQTRVAQATPYYLRFLEAFPTVVDLAEASEEQVLKLWQGLGYYSRARNLHHTAKQVAFDYQGQFPTTYHELLKLKGIGAYTAAAIASIAFDEAVAVVDGNVYRVLARFFGVETDIASSAAPKEFSALANMLLDPKRPAQFNQALMEFGAMQCTPKNPQCHQCPLQWSCVAYRDKKVAELPVKTKKTKITDRYFHYLIVEDPQRKILLEKRTEKGIWHNLYQFPLIETPTPISWADLQQKIASIWPLETINSMVEINKTTILHKLSHQNLYIRFYKISLNKEMAAGVQRESLEDYPFPIVIYNFIKTY